MHAVPQEHEIRRMRILEGVDENATFYKRGQKAFSWGPPMEEKINPNNRNVLHTLQATQPEDPPDYPQIIRLNVWPH
jgi:hypothetical protein